MKLSITLDSSSDTPAYKQIVERITRQVNEGTILPGDRIPAERELAQQLSLARGTVKKAYEKLAHNNIVEVIHGRGTFISFRQNVLVEGRKEKALAVIRSCITDLETLKFSYREISNLFDLELMSRKEKQALFSIAAVDCNPESLRLIERQLKHIARVQVSGFLLDDLQASPDAANKLHPFQLVVTTNTHYSELLGMLPDCQDKLLQMILSPSQESIIQLAKIGTAHTIGIICQSRNYLKIIKTHLRDFQITQNRVQHLLLKKTSNLLTFLEKKDVVIMPAHCPEPWNKDNINALQEFRQRGGRLIEFTYQIERGSLLYLEERIRNVMQQQG